jgi:hypothetical protein
MKNNTVTRGLDSFTPGQLITIKFPGMMDDNFSSSRESPELQQRLQKDLSNASQYPAIVLKKYEDFDSVSYDVGFVSRHRSGQMSGLIKLSKISIWRYLAGDPQTGEEGIPPVWLVEGITEAIQNRENYFDSIGNKELFWCKHIDENTFEKVYF